MPIGRVRLRDESSLDPLVEQLWFGVPGGVRITHGDDAEVGWQDAERYLAVPAHRPRLLLPDSERASTLGALRNYRGLRAGRQRLARAAMTTVAGLGAPVGARLTLQVRSGADEAAGSLPLAQVARALGRGDLRASVGIRTGANRKATLQLVDAAGEPVGYAKMGWSPETDRYVRTETAALRHVGGRDDAMRAPAVLAALSYAGHPVVVTAPLPSDVRAVRRGVPGPSSQELYALCPVVRHAPPRETGHLTALRDRLEVLARDPLTSGVVGQAARAWDDIRAVDSSLPVSSRWHGDLTPWNCARDGSGRLWAWDWESSDEDALTGLDALHWAISEQRETARGVDGLDLPAGLAASAPHLVAAGVPRDEWPTLARVYVLTVLERACTLAVESGGWDSLWISPEQITRLVAKA